MNKWLIVFALGLALVLTAAGCGKSSCAQWRECCDALADAPTNPNVSFLRGSCRVSATRSRQCRSRLARVTDRIGQHPEHAVPTVCGGD